jgi:hypothetical protein
VIVASGRFNGEQITQVAHQFHGRSHASLPFSLLDYLDAIQDPVTHQIAVPAMIQYLALGFYTRID